MSTPRFRHWRRIYGTRVLSGILIGIGLLIMVVAQFLRPSSCLSGKAFVMGMVLAIAGLTGLLTAKDFPPG